MKNGFPRANPGSAPSEAAFHTRENSLRQAQNSVILALRLRAFMRGRDLSRAELAAALRTPERTLDRWLDNKSEPPGIVSAILDVLEQSAEASAALGINRPGSKGRIRGRPFRRGNEHRFRPRTC